MEFRILGPLEVVADGRRLILGGGRQRSLLGVLLLELGRVVPAERLVELIWADEPPETAANVLQVHISQLRRVLEPGHQKREPYRVLVSQSPGYRMQVEPDSVDLFRFEALLAKARDAAASENETEAVELLNEGLALWRGPLFVDLDETPVVTRERARAEEVRLQAQEERFDAYLRLDRHTEVMAELEALAEVWPLRERLQGQRMLALYRSGRQADASDVYQRTRQRLEDELGMEPGPALQKLLKQILTQDPSLEVNPRSRKPQPHNLPIQLTSFVGRQHEVEELKRALAANRLVTLTGSGGCGKTRLAIQTATEVLSEYPDGTCFVDLAPVTDEGLISATVAKALSLREKAGSPMEVTVVEHLASRRQLLVIDNCEYLLEGCAELTSRILAGAPQLHVLATSQQPLNVPGEVRWRVPSLGLPVAGGNGGDHVARLESEAVQLFVERARLVQPDFAIDDQSAPAVAQICRRLDGIPLAIELAAAQVAVLTPADIQARLDDRFRLLGVGKRMAPPRQQTLFAAVSWSYGLLDEGQKVLFRRLSAFAGGFDLEAAEAVGTGSSTEVVDVLALLSGLVEKSLVLAGVRGTGRARYRLLETLREFARARLSEAGEDQEVLTRHAQWFLALAEDAEPELMGADEAIWLARLDTEHDNLRAALAYLRRSRRLEWELRLTGALWRFWYYRGFLNEGRDRLEEILASAGGDLGVEYEKILYGATVLTHRLGDYDRAEKLASDRLAISHAKGDPNLVAGSLLCLGLVAHSRGEHSRAASLLSEAADLARKVSNKSVLGMTINMLGEVALRRGDYDTARSTTEEALALFRESSNASGVAHTLVGLSEIARRQGRTDEAKALDREALRVAHSIRDWEAIIGCLQNLSEQAALEGHADQAARLLGASQALRSETGYSLVAHEQSQLERIIGLLGAELGKERLAKARSDGRAMTLDDAVTYALQAAD